MPDVDLAATGLFPPVQYSPMWGVLAVTLLVLIAAFYILVPVLMRSREAAREPADSSWIPEFPPVPLGEKYSGLIAEVESAHHRGELTVRDAHQRLSLLLRFFAWESSGLRAPQMTLADLREAHATPLSDAVEQLYPGAFAEIERGSVLEAAELARRVVHSWT